MNLINLLSALSGGPWLNAKHWTTGLALGLALLTTSACMALPAGEEVSEPMSTPSSPTSAQTSPQGQQLPITAQATIGETEFFLEVAETPRQQAIGLMFRPPLPDDRGMLFPFDTPRPASFWMRNVPVPLDMIFVYDGTVRAITHSAAPCQALPCPTYGPEDPDQLIDYVIELRGGRAKEIALSVGDSVVVIPLGDSP